jgi:hypothetical protein
MIPSLNGNNQLEHELPTEQQTNRAAFVMHTNNSDSESEASTPAPVRQTAGITEEVLGISSSPTPN